MFNVFKKKIQEKFQELLKSGQLYLTDIDKEILWETYINTFPNEIRQGYTCNACRSFVRNYGNVVGIVGNKIVTIWDVKTDLYYDQVALVMDNLVKSAKIRDKFISKETSLGLDKNRDVKDGEITIWEHFHLDLPNSMKNTSGLSIESVMGSHRDAKNVFRRSLEELTAMLAEL